MHLPPPTWAGGSLALISSLVLLLNLICMINAFFASGKVCIKQQALTTVFCQVIRVYKSFPPSLELYPPCVFARSTLSSLESGPCQSAEKRIKWVKSYNYLNLPPCQWWRWWVRWWGFYSRTTGSRTPPRFPHCSPSKWQPMQISLILG